MMDDETISRHQPRMVDEPEPFQHEPQHLTAQEQKLFDDLRAGVYGGTRLEQERLSPDSRVFASLDSCINTGQRVNQSHH